MAKKLDPRLLEILKQYGENAEEALWDCHGTWVAYHKAIERIAAKANIVFERPDITETDAIQKIAVIVVGGRMGDRYEWSFGEAAPYNNKNAYPYAMAEKRAKDRVVLKLVGLHGLVYSEEESDDFKPQSTPNTVTGKSERYEPPPRKANGLPEVGWREDGSRTSFWLKTSGTAAELKAQLLEDAVDCHTMKQLDELKAFYRGKAKELKFNKQFLDVLLEEFNAIEHSIMESMSPDALADVPLDKALKQSLNVLGAG